MSADRCIAFGCTNRPVRVMGNKEDPKVRFGVCAFHAGTVLKHATEEQARDFLFPKEPRL